MTSAKGRASDVMKDAVADLLFLFCFPSLLHLSELSCSFLLTITVLSSCSHCVFDFSFLFCFVGLSCSLFKKTAMMYDLAFPIAALATPTWESEKEVEIE